MAFPTSCWFGDTLRDTLADTIDLGSAGTVSACKIALYVHDAAGTPFDANSNFDKNTDAGAYNAGEWTTSVEVSSAGYTAAGQSLNTPAFANASGVLTFAETDLTKAWTGVTLSTRGALVYVTGINRGICAINFGTDISVTAGDLTITWNTTTKIASISY